MNDDQKRHYRSTLIERLNESFSPDELNSLAFKLLGIGKLEKEEATDLVKQVERQRLFVELLKLCQTERPRTDWPLPPDLEEEALRMERNQAYQPALNLWSLLPPHHPHVAQAIDRLQNKLSLATRLTNLKKQLLKRSKDIPAVYLKVATRLNRIEKGELDAEAEVILHTIDQFLAGEFSGSDFLEVWPSLEQPSPASNLTPRYSELARLLQCGEIVVFLGSDEPALFDQRSSPSHKLVAHLQAQETAGRTFLEICEYQLLTYQTTRNSLRTDLRTELHQIVETPVTIPFYQLLARLNTPLILFSTTYDRLLEKTFKAAGKKFVVLCHSTEAIGTLFLEYSDNTSLQCCSVENLSGLQLLEQGYSLIYKIFGRLEVLTCPASSEPKDASMLVENDYLVFLQHESQLFPAYLINQLKGRGFWWLGHAPQSWEKRLIINDILRKRGANAQPAIAVQPDTDEFTRAYWSGHAVTHYQLELAKFVRELQRCL